jgi:hypothetical protein
VAANFVMIMSESPHHLSQRDWLGFVSTLLLFLSWSLASSLSLSPLSVVQVLIEHHRYPKEDVDNQHEEAMELCLVHQIIDLTQQLLLSHTRPTL